MSLGFFNSKDFKINNPAALGDGCGKCRLYKTCCSPKIGSYGRHGSEIMILGEFPSEADDVSGIPLSGKVGQFLDFHLRKLGVDAEQDVVKLNAVHCRPPENRLPSDLEIENCRGRVWKLIKSNRPKVIIALGAIAVKSLLSHRWYEVDEEGEVSGLGSIDRWRGWTIPDRETECWVVPCHHPLRIIGYDDEKQQANVAGECIFSSDLKKAIRCLTLPLPAWKKERECVELLTDASPLSKRLNELKNSSGIITLDYETTGLKPYNDGHRIVCAGIAVSEEEAFVFPTQNMKEPLRIFRDIMISGIRKIAHNMQFEDLWTRERLGVQIQNWQMCTMQAAHILDQRKGISGLKFQSYVQTGLVDYSSHISSYLSPLPQDKKRDGDNALNQIHKAPPRDLLMYCGIDCIATYRLAQIQAKELGVDLHSKRGLK